MQRQLRWALVLATLIGVMAGGTGAYAFALLQGYVSPSLLPRAERWVDGFGLEDGIQVGVEAGFEAALGVEAPEDVALLRAAILESLRTWETPVLQFDVTFDATVERGAGSGYEIDILAVPGDDPVFGGQIWFGLAELANTYLASGRTLTNGTVAAGWVVTGGDVYINATLVVAMSVLLSDDQQRLDALQRLTTHEVGHVLGLHHPNNGGFDTDSDPFNAMPIDPVDPSSNLIFQFNYDPAAVMAASPCGGGLIVCPNLFVKDLRPDDIGGLDALYPVVVACGDELDDDGDGLTDYPDDPGCARVTDDTETDLSLPCDDGVDNDGDGGVDFDPVTYAASGDQHTLPAGSGDPGCIDPSWETESPQCQDGTDNDGDGMIDYDGGLSALGYVADEPDPSCAGKPWRNSENEPTPTATPTFLPTPSPTSTASPTPTPTPGRPAICADGFDNDGDGLTDYPADPGCASISDLTETDPGLICDDGLDNDSDGLIDFPNDPGCDDLLDPSESSPTPTPTPGTPTPTPTPATHAPLDKGQQSCVNEMNKNGAKVNKAQLKENETCLKDHQKGKLTTTFEVCTTDDRKNKMQKADDRTVEGEARNCDSLPVAPPFAFTGSTTVFQAAVDGGQTLTREIFGDPVNDADLATKVTDKDTAKCQLEMLKQANKLEDTVLKELNKAKRSALQHGTVDSASALESALVIALMRVPITKVGEKLTKAEEKLEKRVDKKCGELGPPNAIFPGECGVGDPSLADVEACVIAAARCQACLKIEAFDGLDLPCDRLDDGGPNWSCP